MKKKSAPKKLAGSLRSFGPLISGVRSLVQSARRAAAASVNTLQTLTNFEIGRRIVEHEQKGATRAEYGAALLKELSARLTEEFGRGFSRANLEYMRKFSLTWQNRVAQISQQPIGKLMLEEKCQHPAGKSQISQQPSGKLIPHEISEQPSAKFRTLFSLSWTHYVLLLTIKDPEERSFYEIEAASEGWSIPEFKRQVASCLYERLALSRSKKAARKLADEGQIITRPEDLLKEPYVFEFLGLDERAEYSESDLETAIITQLERFLLELGKGFLFADDGRKEKFLSEVSALR